MINKKWRVFTYLDENTQQCLGGIQKFNVTLSRRGVFTEVLSNSAKQFRVLASCYVNKKQSSFAF